MRWFWIDKFEAFEPGQSAVAVKCVSAAEDHLHDHFPGFPVMPTSLMIEGMAQTSGILVGEARNFAEKVILAKVKRATFYGLVRPGETIRYETRIEQITESAAGTAGRIMVGDDLIGEIELVFSHIDQNMSGLEFPEENFVFTDDFMSLLNSFRERTGERVAL